MARKILMTGKDAQYIGVRTNDAQFDDRQILMTGDNATYTEIVIGTPSAPDVEDADAVEIKPEELPEL